MRRFAIAGSATSALMALLAVSAADGQRAAKPVSPQSAVAAITSALETHPLVAIGEVHRNQQLHDLIVALVRDARFLPKGGDVVVEFGSGRYQDLMDRYIAGETVDPKRLSRAWRDAVNILVWDAPVYERFFATVRDANRTRPVARRIRVVLADPAVNWAAINDRAAWERVAATRDEHFADVVVREVLAHGRHALLVFGSGHVERDRAFDRSGKPGRNGWNPGNLAERLDRTHPGATYWVTTDWENAKMDTLFARWRPPVVVPLKGTVLGAMHLGPASETPRLGDLADAFLYLGPTSSLTTSAPPPELYADTVYLRELLRRDAIQGGANSAELRALRRRFLAGRTRG